MKLKDAVKKINDRGALLVFPINNKKEPLSLWSEFHPRKKMRWEWDNNGDDSVAQLWHLMKKLSDSREVVYSKWYQGRATFFSLDLFVSLLRISMKNFENPNLSRKAREILSELEQDSPLSTKQIKMLVELRGRDNESTYSKAMKELFNQFLIVAYGEVDDGAFPSLAVGSTRVLFEDLFLRAQGMSFADAEAKIDSYLPAGSLFRKYLEKCR